MARMKMTGKGELVPFTAEEEAEADATAATQAQQEAEAAKVVYRKERAAAYKAQLGNGDSSFAETTGDVLDAIIKHIYGDTTELDAIAEKIAAIKAANPKPKS
mgnify:CR=1 FL=1